jgi:hypothetical protein
MAATRAERSWPFKKEEWPNEIRKTYCLIKSEMPRPKLRVGLPVTLSEL